MIYCFDTSAVNRLLDDLEREPIIQAVLGVASFRITAYNVLEAAKTSDVGRRSALIVLMRRLASRKRPLDRPNTILLNYARAHADHASSATVNRDEQLEGLWIALNQPDLLDDESRTETFDWAKQHEEDFGQLIAGDRDEFQRLFEREPGARPKSAASTIREYLKKQDECHSLVGDVYGRHTGRSLSDSEYRDLIREPVWPLYLLAYAYGIHQRSIQEEGFSARRNAGAVDLGQAVYLTLCDRFVTNDQAQYRALRLLNVFNTKRRTEVIRYDAFRKRLLVFA